MTSTELFMARLVAVHGWRSMRPWVAAQDTLRSVGDEFRANLPLAKRVASEIGRDAARHPCGALTGGVPANVRPGSHGLPDGYVIPASATPTEAKVVAFAIAQLDKPYVFGASGPQAYDCSGLTMAAWARVGVGLPHLASAQALAGVPTTAAALVPGDLVLVPGDDGTLAAPGHVGIYIGSGLVLNAADEHDGIRVQTYSNFIAVGHGLSALRHIG
jgi:cell wall-associated NlpC family hydrolase